MSGAWFYGKMADLLIVDDDADITAALEALMESEGHVVRTAQDGDSGLRALSARLPDVLITDVEMPLLDGPGMAHRMLVENCGKEAVPIVIISGAQDLARIARRVGTPYSLAKPFGATEVLDVLARALAERTPPSPKVSD